MGKTFRRDLDRRPKQHGKFFEKKSKKNGFNKKFKPNKNEVLTDTESYDSNSLDDGYTN